MHLDNSIENPIAGWVWLLGGMSVASAWLGPKIREFNRRVGFWGWVKSKTDSPKDRKAIDVQAQIFLFFAAWLVLYFILDFIF